jgi:hypothetical protein
MACLKNIFVATTALVCLIAMDLCAQSGAVRQAEKKIAQGNFEAAHQLLLKSLRKDTINPEVETELARWYLNNKNPARQVDSSYNRCLHALKHFSLLTLKQKLRLKRGDQFDSMTIISLRKKIDSAAFDRAKQINTEQSYNDFLAQHLFSVERPEATELRDEVAFLDALRQNTYQIFESYMQRYPNSLRAAEAKSRYEKLLYETLTRDHKLKSYEAFVKDFPQSPYRRVAMRNIFEPLTSSGKISDFVKFVERYPTSYFSKAARDIVFHIAHESEEKFPEKWMTDSLTNVIQLNRLPWIPIYKNGKYGFIDSEGRETVTTSFDGINEDYKCGSITDDLLMTSQGLVSRSGRIISSSKTFKDLGYGFIKVGDSCSHVLHKSGRVIVTDCIQDASVLDGRFLRVTRNGLLGLYALNGRMILKPEWRSIEIIENVFVLNRLAKKVLFTSAQLELAADGNSLPETFVVDEVRSIGKNRLLVSNGSLQGIINSDLQYEVQLAIQSLRQTPVGLVRKVNDQYVFSDLPEVKEEHWDNYSIHHQWLLLKNTSGQKLFDTYSKQVKENNPDSLWFVKGLAFASMADSIHVHIDSKRKVCLPRDSKTFFIKSPDSLRYFFVEHKNKKTVFSISSGEKMFTSDFDQIESLNENYFIITKKGKKGLITIKDKIVLPVEYDALVQNSGKLSLLKGKKFGWYDLNTNELIKPVYEKNLVPLNDHFLIAFQNGHYGLTDKTGKPVGNFEYEEIRPWSDSVIWVKQNSEWNLIDMRHHHKILAHLKDFQLIKNSSSEKLALIKQENLYGVVSTTKGLVIPPSFTTVLNLGNEDEPLYFTSKEVEEAGIVAVIYYDKDGKLIRKQVYEEEDYAKIICLED